MHTVIVVGAGASGLMAAARAAQCGATTLLLERGPAAGRKLAIAGKGRCNVTSAASTERFIEAFGPNGKFLYGALARFSPAHLRELLATRGVPTVVERGERVFPASGQADDVVQALTAYATQSGATIRMNTRVRALIVTNAVAGGVMLHTGEPLTSDAVILCTGGVSYPATGSTGDGYRMAQEVGHTIHPLHPALSAVVTAETEPAELQGLSLRNVRVSLTSTASSGAVERLGSEFGEMLFTHFGLSGPVVLTLSRRVPEALANGQAHLTIDLKPALDDATLDARLQRELASPRTLGRILHTLMPRALAPVIARRCELDSTQRGCQVTRSQRLLLRETLKALRYTVQRLRPADEAIVTAGGVDLREVDPRSMQSRLVKGLYLAGEVLDLDAVTGGFNLQAAFSTGWVAGESAARQTSAPLIAG